MARRLYPFPREAVGRVPSEARRVGGLNCGDTPHPDARVARVDPPHYSLWRASALPSSRGEG